MLLDIITDWEDLKESEAELCQHWDDWEDEEGDFCDYLTYRYGIEFDE